MTSIIRIEALSGANDETPLSYLLQVDEFFFLLDCGWDDGFDMQYIERVKKKAHLIDAVLLTYADLPHLGALPYLVGKCGLTCPIYATVPVYKMGQMFLYDWFQAHQNVEDFDMFTLDDVDLAFDKINQLKFSQNVSLKGKGHGLQITPFAAGHMIGGTFWRILKGGEEEIVYAVDYNHKKERHLNACSFDAFSKPNLLITDAFNAKYQQARRKQRDEQLLTHILQTMRAGGNVLLCIDTAGRVLELAQLLDQLWHNEDARLMTYSLVMVNNVAYNVVEFAKSQIEWMSDKVMRSFEEGRFNPFHFRHVQICHSLNELRKVRTPMVALASFPDMESGFSREIFLDFCNNPKNTVILTSRSYPGTLARQLIDIANSPDKRIEVEVKRRVRLEGVELNEFLQARKQKNKDLARQRLEAQRRLAKLDTESSDEEDEAADGEQPEVLHPHDIMLRHEHHAKASFFKQARRHYPMFPFVEVKVKSDDYGEIIRPEDYMTGDQVLVPHGSEVVKSEEATDAELLDIPTKCVAHMQKIDVQCAVTYIDFEGRSDGESIKKLITTLKPKQIVLVHGTPDSTQHLAEYCRSQGMARVFTPSVGETVDATIESHIYQVTLTDVLMSSLAFQPVKDAELAWVDAMVSMRQKVADNQTATEDTEGDKEPADAPMTDATEPCLDVLPATSEAPTHTASGVARRNFLWGVYLDKILVTPLHTAVFINDPRLSDFKHTLMRLKFQAEFSAGVLYVNNVVAIRRLEPGKFHFEGTVCNDYFKVRDLFYKQFAVV